MEQWHAYGPDGSYLMSFDSEDDAWDAVETYASSCGREGGRVEGP